MKTDNLSTKTLRRILRNGIKYNSSLVHLDKSEANQVVQLLSNLDRARIIMAALILDDCYEANIPKAIRKEIQKFQNVNHKWS